MNNVLLCVVLSGLAAVATGAFSAVAWAANDASFTGTVVYTPQDSDNDGIYDALEATLEVEIRTPGDYSFQGRLFELDTWNPVATLPHYGASTGTRTDITASDTPDAYPALFSVPLLFSGEQIFRSGVDGPYTLLAQSIDPNMAKLFTTDAVNHEQFGEYDAWATGGTEQVVDEDGDMRFDCIEVAPEVVVRVEGDYTIRASLRSPSDTFIVGSSSPVHLVPGGSSPPLQLPGQTIRRAGVDGPYRVEVWLDGPDTEDSTAKFETAAYNASDFAVLVETDGQLEDSGYDINDNGLFELLQSGASIDLTSTGTYVMSGWLLVGTAEIEATQVLIGTGGPQNVEFEFSGPEIYSRETDGPYQLRIVVHDSSATEVLDSVTLPDPTADYQYTAFEPTDLPPADIRLTGENSDHGVDLDDDGFFDELHVDVGLELAQSGNYHWAVRLFNADGIDLGYSHSSGELPQGTASIGFVFSGSAISAAGVDGPYFVRSLQIYCDPWPPGTPSLYATLNSETQPYSVGEFGCLGTRPCYSGPADTLNAGACVAGTQTCTDGTWDACTGEVTPTSEDCADGVDNDCNGDTDAADSACTPSCNDADDDGWGNPASDGCTQPGLDCDDRDAAVHPGAVETCNGRDDNCQDGIADEVCPECSEGDTRPCYSGPAVTVNVGACLGGTQTCTDGTWDACTGEVTPTAEDCVDGVDNDCNGDTDASDSACTPSCNDADQDGWGDPASEGCTQPGLDCDDLDTTVHPGAIETCNGRDDNCQDGIADEVCPECSEGGTRDCYSGPANTLNVGACQAGIQTCTDGAWEPCTDEVTPTAEDCHDGVDSDCDGMVDVADRLDCASPSTPSQSGGCAQGGTAGGTSPAVLLLGLAICGLWHSRRRLCQ